MSLDGHLVRGKERDGFSAVFSAEHPFATTLLMEVLILDPAFAFLVMATIWPSPQGLVYLVIDGLEGFSTHHMALILCPASNDGVEHKDQTPSRNCGVRLDEGTNLLQEALDVLLGGLDDEFTVVLTDGLPKEVKAFFDMDDACFLW